MVHMSDDLFDSTMSKVVCLLKRHYWSIKMPSDVFIDFHLECIRRDIDLHTLVYGESGNTVGVIKSGVVYGEMNPYYIA